MRNSLALFSFLLIGFFFSLSACKDADGMRTLPNSTGRIDEILVVMDSAQWRGEVGEVVREILTEEYLGLPQVEARFAVRFLSPNNMVDLLKRASTILFISDLSKDGRTTRLINKQIEKLPEGTKADYMFTSKDVWARPQQLIYIYGQSEEELVQTLVTKKETIHNRIYEVEDNKAMRNAYSSQINKGFRSKLKQEFGFNFPIPNSFREAIFSDTLVWYRQDLNFREGSETSNITIHIKEYDNETDFNSAYPIDVRNNLGYLWRTETIGSYMLTDTIADPYQKMVEVDNMPVIESRGLWYMSADFMGGAFINYCIKDEANRRLIVLDGVIYAPEMTKKKAIRKMENIFKRFKLSKEQ